MARPRTVSDAQILEATERVVARLGPHRFTLADVGQEVGLTASAVLKRFASKRALLLAMSAASRARVPAAFARRSGERALDALRRALREQARGFDTPEELGNGFAFLQLDVTDPEFNAVAREFFASFHESVRGLVEEAVRERELRRCDAAAVATLVEHAWNGSIVSWGVRQEGACGDAVVSAVDGVLAPFAPRHARWGLPL